MSKPQAFAQHLIGWAFLLGLGFVCLRFGVEQPLARTGALLGLGIAAAVDLPACWLRLVAISSEKQAVAPAWGASVGIEFVGLLVPALILGNSSGHDRGWFLLTLIGAFFVFLIHQLVGLWRYAGRTRVRVAAHSEVATESLR